MNWLTIIGYQWKAQRLAKPWRTSLTQICNSISLFSAEYGLPPPLTKSDEMLLRAYQILSFVDLMSRHPEYIPRADFQLFAGAVQRAVNGENASNVDDAGRVLLGLTDDLQEASFALAMRFCQYVPGESDEALIQYIAVTIHLMGKQSQQALALLFKDQATVLLLQEEKLALQRTLHEETGQ